MSDSLVLSVGHQLRDRAHALADATVACEFSRHPELRARYGPAGRVKSRQDAVCHFSYLADAVDFDSPALFRDYVAWAKVMLQCRGVHAEDLGRHLACMADALRQQMPAPVADPAVALLDATRAALPNLPDTLFTCLAPEQRLSGLAREYLHTLLGGYRAGAARLVLDAADRGEPVRDLYLQVFQPALREIGRLWQLDKINVAQEHFCSAATQVAMAQLLPRALPAERHGHGVMVACVRGDLHDLGARMVADFFEMAGWDVWFCGASTPHADLVQTLAGRATDVLAISATMGKYLHQVQELIELVRAHPRCARLRILVGGHPFAVDPALWQRLGADGTAGDAEAAVALAGRWVAEAGPAG